MTSMCIEETCHDLWTDVMGGPGCASDDEVRV